MNTDVDVHLLREYAGRAMQALIVTPWGILAGDTATATAAYRYAQAMCEEDQRLHRERVRADMDEAKA